MLPSNTEKNPKASINSITLRSGRQTFEKHQPPPMVEISQPREEDHEKKHENVKVPYPGRLVKQKMDEQFGKFLEPIKQLHVNLPFVDILTKMPKYEKFLRNILSNKKKLEELSLVTHTEQCSVINLNDIPSSSMIREISSFHATSVISTFEML